MTSPLKPRCRNNHVITRWEPAPCEGGHKHLISICRMRMGSKSCGDVTVLPPYSANCEKD